jgi:RimJ/RimL family protein N-acetyltransferase
MGSHLSWGSAVVYQSHVRARIQRASWFQAGIAEQADHRLIGDCAFMFLRWIHAAEIGITIAPALQGNGYAK